jgi:lysophospholipase
LNKKISISCKVIKGNDCLLSEMKYRHSDDPGLDELLGWQKRCFTFDWLNTPRGAKIRFAFQKVAEPRAVILIVNGRSEFIEKYAEVCRDLQDMDAELWIYDHYGQGGSDRPLEDPHKGHIDDFTTYVDDLTYLITEQVRPPQTVPFILLTHSMGSTIATLFAATHGHLMAGMIHHSPMLGINTGYLPEWGAEKISAYQCSLGHGEQYVWGGGPFVEMAFKNNVLTSDETRFSRTMTMMSDMQGLALGAPTFGWLYQAYRAIELAKEAAQEIEVPTLVQFSARDRLVSVAPMDEFCTLRKNCRKNRFEEGEHELLMERDPIRARVLAELKSFIDEICQRSGNNQSST